MSGLANQLSLVRIKMIEITTFLDPPHPETMKFSLAIFRGFLVVLYLHTFGNTDIPAARSRKLLCTSKRQSALTRESTDHGKRLPVNY